MDIVSDKEKRKYSGRKRKTIPMIVSFSIIFMLVGMALAQPPIGNGMLDDLTDCNVPSPDDGDVLTYDTATANWTAEVSVTGKDNLAELNDVDVTGVQDNDFLQYNGTHWVDFDLFNTANTWLQTNTFNQDVTVDGTTSLQNTLIGDGGTTDFVRINETGVVSFYGDAKFLNRVTISAIDWYAYRFTVSPTATLVGIFPLFNFSNIEDNFVYYTISIPSGTKFDSNITITVDWCYTGNSDNGYVNWYLAYNVIDSGESVEYGVSSLTQRSNGYHVSGDLIRTVFKNTIGDAKAHSDIGLNLIRDVSEDTLGTSAGLIAVHFDFVMDSLGEPIS